MASAGGQLVGLAAFVCEEVISQLLGFLGNVPDYRGVEDAVCSIKGRKFSVFLKFWLSAELGAVDIYGTGFISLYEEDIAVAEVDADRNTAYRIAEGIFNLGDSVCYVICS